jgi:tripartite-type tricarboxylate transporter receptor subunit TctC
MRASIVTVIASLLIAAPAPRAIAQNWPTRPVTMVVPYAAGSGSDLIGRILAKRLSELLATQVIVENIGGAGGMTGAYRVAKAPPDGYQFVLGTTGTHAMNQSIYRKPLYDAVVDFAPVALVAEQPVVLIARKDLPVTNLRDFIAYAQSHHAKMQFGSGGVGSSTHLACALLNSAIGISVTHVPYRAGILAVQDMIAGRIDYACPIASIVTPQIGDGQVKAIAMLSTTRSPILPNLASTQEQGVANLDSENWNAVFLPKGTPAPIVRKLNAATVEAMNTPDVEQRLKDIGVTLVAPEHRTPDYLAGFMRDEIVKWAAVIKAAGVTAD